MSVQPNDKLAKIGFCENHTSVWNTQATLIGTTTAAVTDLTTKTTAARSAYNAQQAAQQAAKAATATYVQAVRVMAQATQAIIDQIRVKAVTVGDSVYALAEIPAPATPTPMPPLGKPSDFNVAIDLATGALDLTWKNTNPPGAGGATFQIWRRIGATGQFEYLGGAGAKKYTDTTIPAGTSQVQYKIQSVRSTSVGPVAQFIVNFGSGSSGEMTASVTESGPVRMAA